MDMNLGGVCVCANCQWFHIAAKKGFGFLKMRAQVNLSADRERHPEQCPCQTEALFLHLKHFTEIKPKGAKKVEQRTKATSPIAQDSSLPSTPEYIRIIQVKCRVTQSI